MPFGSDEDESTGGVEQAKVYRLQSPIDTVLLLLPCVVLMVIVSVLVARSFIAGTYGLLAGAAFLLALATAYLLSVCVPLSPSVQISDIGITARAWSQQDRFVPWSAITGLIWLDTKVRRGHFCALFLEVPALAYGRSRIKLGTSFPQVPGTGISELCREIVKHCGLQKVPQPSSFWRSVGRLLGSRKKRQVWRSQQFS